MDNEQDSLQVVLSEGILQSEKFGVYLISEANPDIEYQLVGGCNSLDEARTRAQEVAGSSSHGPKGAGPDLGSIQFRKRPKLAIDSALRLMSEKELEESIRAHFDHSITQLTKSKFVKALLSYENFMFVFTCVAIWLFWTNGSFTVPKGLDLPLIGNRLDGVIMKTETLARYFPICLFALYVGKFLLLLKTNLEYDLVRRKLLALVFLRGWRFQQFVLLRIKVEASMEKSGLAWLVNVSNWFSELDPASLGNLQKQSEAVINGRTSGPSATQKVKRAAKQIVQSDLRAELDQKLSEWIPTEFERRIHNLYFLDKEKDYSRFAICFDPVVYVSSLNRILFRAYEFLLKKRAPVDTFNAPRDPYLIQRFAVPMFWLSVALQIFFLGAVMVWSFFVAVTLPKQLFVVNLLAMVLVLSIPNWWNYLAIVKSRGYPKFEPLGAYTVGPLAPERLSLL